MRVSPVGWAYNTLEEVLAEAEKSASVSHNHPDGIKGAQAVAASVFLARSGKTKEEIKNYITNQFDYDLNRKIEDIRPDYQFSVLCSESVPESIIAFLESNSYEEAIRLAISLGGDSDTQACIAGAIAEAFYGEVPQEIIEEVIKRLRPELHNLLIQFSIKYREETKGLK
jgi:ADP-ribosylglycohydrolase